MLVLARRGGYWNNGCIRGVFNLNLNNTRSNSNHNVGARPALPRSLIRYSYGYIVRTGRKGILFHPHA